MDPISSLLRTLNSNADPRQIALGMALGMVMGLTPLMSLHNLFILLLVFILRINLAGLLFSLGIFSAFAYRLDPLFDQIGVAILQAPSLNGLWTDMYNNAFWRLSHFDYPIVMGSLSITLLLLVPFYLLLVWAIGRYRQHWMKLVEKLHLTKVMKLLGGLDILRRN